MFEKFSSHLGPCCGVRQCLLNFKVSRPGMDAFIHDFWSLFGMIWNVRVAVCGRRPCEHAPHLSKAFAKRCLLRFVNWRAAAPSAAASSKSNGLYFQGDQSSQLCDSDFIGFCSLEATLEATHPPYKSI